MEDSGNEEGKEKEEEEAEQVMGRGKYVLVVENIARGVQSIVDALPRRALTEEGEVTENEKRTIKRESHLKLVKKGMDPTRKTKQEATNERQETSPHMRTARRGRGEHEWDGWSG